MKFKLKDIAEEVISVQGYGSGSKVSETGAWGP